MKRLIILEMILMSFIWSPIVMANIYTWTDENNVRHFTNQVPPTGAEIFLMDSGPEPASSPETPDQIEKNDLTTENQNLQDRLNDTQEKLSETLEKVNTLEDKILNSNDRAPGAIKSEENADSESIDNSSYSEPEDKPTRSTYYYPAGIIRSSHFAKKSHYRPRSSHRRPHKGGYYYRKHKGGEHHNLKGYYKKRYFRGHLYKKHHYGNQHRRNRYLKGTHNRSRRLNVHNNSRNLNLEFSTSRRLSSVRKRMTKP